VLPVGGDGGDDREVGRGEDGGVVDEADDVGERATGLEAGTLHGGPG